MNLNRIISKTLNVFKNKYVFFLLRFCIVCIAFYILSKKTANTSYQEIDVSIVQICLLLGFTFFNWFFEILKWKKLTSPITSISLLESTKQSLTAHTVSIITPYKIGEYGSKALFFEEKLRKPIVGLNWIGNCYQLLTTVLFGIIGFVCFFPFEINPFLNGINVMLLSIFILVTSYILSKFLNLKRLLNFFQKLSTIEHTQVFIYSIFRYLFFSHQFYFFLVIFGVDLSYSLALAVIFSMYLLASIVPSLSIFDFAIKGSVAIYLFGYFEINEMTIATITFFMWGCNFALPAILGSYFLLRLKSKKQHSYGTS